MGRGSTAPAISTRLSVVDKYMISGWMETYSEQQLPNLEPLHVNSPCFGPQRAFQEIECAETAEMAVRAQRIVVVRMVLGLSFYIFSCGLEAPRTSEQQTNERRRTRNPPRHDQKERVPTLLTCYMSNTPHQLSILCGFALHIDTMPERYTKAVQSF